MFKNTQIQSRLFVAALTIGGLYGCSKQESQDVRPASTEESNKTVNGSQKDTTGTAIWKRFISNVEAGTATDPKGQYVSKATYVDNGGNGARPTRPKSDDTNRRLALLPWQQIGTYAGTGTGTTYMDDQLEVPQDDTGGGGAYVPNFSRFSSTEIVQPWNVSPSYAKSGKNKTNNFYTTENPNGLLYDLKIVKGPNSNRPPFHNNPYYHNIPIDLNEGAGGSYIYISFTRDPSHVEYNNFTSDECDEFGDASERPRVNGVNVNWHITGIDTQINCCNGLISKCFGGQNNFYKPMYCASDFYVNGDFMRVPDLNDGAGGSYAYAFQSRGTGTAIEVGVVTGNNANIQPPAGWMRVGSDLNRGAGGSYIFLCKKNR